MPTLCSGVERAQFWVVGTVTERLPKSRKACEFVPVPGLMIEPDRVTVGAPTM